MAHATAVLDSTRVNLEVTAHVLEHTGGRPQCLATSRQPSLAPAARVRRGPPGWEQDPTPPVPGCDMGGSTRAVRPC